jgi:nucleoside-specific outer membrane channel protein Tsx
MQRLSLFAAAALLAVAGSARAADWSDTSISVRYGTSFEEPFDPNQHLAKGIVGLTHADGDKYGTDFFNADILLSGKGDPGSGTTQGAQEIYVVYRRLLDFGKISGSDFKMGPVRGYGATAGFDLNSKNDSYGSKKRMLVIGPTVMLDVPGFLNISVLMLAESNAPNGIDNRYHYKNHAALDAVWGIGIPGPLPLSLNGYFDFIGAKGTNEFGGKTAPETHLDTQLMLDAGSLMAMPKGKFQVGIEYEFWKNKFGNPTTAPGVPFGAGPGATAHTPEIRAEYHF